MIGIDTVCTLVGQPPEFWGDPQRAVEGNDFFALFLEQGAVFFLWTSALYILGAVLAASVLPRRFALIALLAYVLGHYFGASTWLSYAFGFGMWVIVTYGLVIATSLVLLGVDVRAIPEKKRPHVT